MRPILCSKPKRPGMSAIPPTAWLIVDGNNLIHHHPELAVLARRNFDHARRALVEHLAALGAVLASRITVVFDGTRGGHGEGFEGTGVEVLFSPAHLTADAVIERLVHAAPAPDAITVVSSDRLERDTVEAAGAVSLSCRSFVEHLETAQRRLREQHGRPLGSPPGPATLGDYFPE